MYQNANRLSVAKLFLALSLIGLMATGCRGCKVFSWFDKDGQDVDKVDGRQTNGQPDDPDGPGIKRPPERPSDPATALTVVHFDYDSAQLTPQAREALLSNVAWLKAHPEEQILIEGHCDERGTIQYNLALGERRANSVRSFYTGHGIAAGLLFPISYGEEQPVDPAYGEEHWRKNRRAEFRRYEQ